MGITRTVNVEDYAENAKSLAKTFVEEFVEVLADHLNSKGKVPTDHYSVLGGERFFNESLCDEEYDLKESVELLEQLSHHEETDVGLWEGQDPKEGIKTMAYRTFQNAVQYEITDLLKDINRQYDEAEVKEKAGLTDDDDLTTEQIQAAIRMIVK